MADYDSMTVDQLEQENERLMAERTRIGEEQDILKAALNRKLTGESTESLIDSLSDAQREALREALRKEG